MAFKIEGLKRKTKTKAKATTNAKIQTKAKVVPKRKPEGLNPAQIEALNQYRIYAPIDYTIGVELSNLVAFNISSYHKIKMLMLSVVESGKPSEQNKMRSFLRGFLQPTGNDKLQHEVKVLESMFEEYVEDGNPEHLLASFAKTDISLKA